MKSNSSSWGVVPVTLLALSGAAIAAGYGTDDMAREPSRLVQALKDAPPLAARRQNPFADESSASRAGAKLFRQHCASCHGEGAEGRDNAPALRSAVIRQTPPGVLFWFLRNGNLRQGMPSWSGLPDQQRWQLVSYLKTLH